MEKEKPWRAYLRHLLAFEEARFLHILNQFLVGIATAKPSHFVGSSLWNVWFVGVYDRGC